ncbi:MAG: V-type ATP synthase subunit K [Spirochaetaceae bacterium]|nr:V-type ATP synthase subunit K [Spirochaetaceae bacterium]
MNLGEIGFFAAFALAALGSVYGIVAGSLGAIGAWKKGFLNGKNADMSLVFFASFPLSQSLYGFVLMLSIRTALNSAVVIDGVVQNSLPLGVIGLFAGAVIGLCAALQGKVCAAAADAKGETGKGLAQYIIVLGVLETVALFAMAFGMLMVGGLS